MNIENLTLVILILRAVDGNVSTEEAKEKKEKKNHKYWLSVLDNYGFLSSFTSKSASTVRGNSM